MKTLTATMASLALLGPAGAGAEAESGAPAMSIVRGGAQASGKGPDAYFTGAVRVDPLFQPNALRRRFEIPSTRHLIASCRESVGQRESC